MRISGQATLAAGREQIWPLIFDPTALLQLLPGCTEVQQVAPDEYVARLTLRVPALAGEYSTRVKVEEAAANAFCRFSGEANGPAGSVRGAASFRLAPEGEGTRLEYQGDALISGPLAGMNPRFAEGVAKTLIGQGLAKLPELAAERTPAREEEPAATARPFLLATVRAVVRSAVTLTWLVRRIMLRLLQS